MALVALAKQWEVLLAFIFHISFKFFFFENTDKLYEAEIKVKYNVNVLFVKLMYIKRV